MEKITYTEIFYSLLGEGKWTGVPSIFFRTYGCNFRRRRDIQPRDKELRRYLEALNENHCAC